MKLLLMGKINRDEESLNLKRTVQLHYTYKNWNCFILLKLSTYRKKWHSQWMPKKEKEQIYFCEIHILWPLRHKVHKQRRKGWRHIRVTHRPGFHSGWVDRSSAQTSCSFCGSLLLSNLNISWPWIMSLPLAQLLFFIRDADWLTSTTL